MQDDPPHVLAEEPLLFVTVLLQNQKTVQKCLVESGRRVQLLLTPRPPSNVCAASSAVESHSGLLAYCMRRKSELATVREIRLVKGRKPIVR